MHPCLLFLFAFNTITAVNAGLFVVKPLQGFTCHAGQPCRVDWLDDGIHPLLTAIGVVDVGLYHEKQQLVQTIQSVNVATAHSLTFTPIPGAGPNSDNYYISLVSTSPPSNTSQHFTAYSSLFRLDGMTGYFDRPQSAATPSFPVPPSVATSNRPFETGDVLSTITIGVISSTSPTSTSSISSKPPYTVSPAADNSMTLDIPIVNALTTMPSRFSTLISPPSTTPSAVESLLSSSPLPSATIADTSSPNGATLCSISSAINIFIAVVTLYLVMCF